MNSSSRFDQEASLGDQNPGRVEVARAQAGFLETALHDAHEIQKPDAAGRIQSYPVSLAIGRKHPLA